MRDTPSTGERLGMVLASVTAILYLLPSTIVLGLLATLFSWLPPRGSFMLLMARLWSRGLLVASGVRLDPRFEVALDGERSHIYLANHQSYFDIPALLPLIPGQVRFAAKRSLFRIPIFGWALHAGGFIPVDRRDQARARQAFTQAADRLAGGRSVFFFPEGTRSWDGRLGELERGGFLLALRTGIPIVPVGISGSRRVMPRGAYRIRPGTVRVRFGRPIDPADYGLRGRRRLTAEVRRQIAELAGLDEEEGPEVPAGEA